MLLGVLLIIGIHLAESKGDMLRVDVFDADVQRAAHRAVQSVHHRLEVSEVSMTSTDEGDA